MKNPNYIRGIWSAAIALTFLSVNQASAEDIIRTKYTITLTDPDSGAVYSSERISVRSWASVDRCDAEKDSFKERHIKSLNEYAFVNAAGQRLKINISAGDCEKQ